MKSKALLSLIITILMVVFISCDDDLNKIGNSILPEGDDIFVYVDTVAITARTVSLEDSVYAKSQMGLLGNYVLKILSFHQRRFLSIRPFLR